MINLEIKQCSFLRRIFCITFAFLGLVLFGILFPSFADELKLEKIGKAIQNPWGMSQLDRDTWLVTSRPGQLYKVNIRTGEHKKIENSPPVFAKRQGGLLDVMVFKDHVYLCLSRPLSNNMSATALYKAKLDGNVLKNGAHLFTSNKTNTRGVHFGCRLNAFKDNIYLTLGDRGDRESAQDINAHAGAVIRLSPKGVLFKPANENWIKGLFSKGHRNPQGMALNPRTNKLWIHEHGPKGGDEINILVDGQNYGWPVVTFGREYSGGKVGQGLTRAEGYEDPVWYWVPSIAPSGMVFYEGKMFPELKGDLLVGSLKFRNIYHVRLQNELPVSEAKLLKQNIGRIRDIDTAPDGSLLILTDEVNGGLYRLSR